MMVSKNVPRWPGAHRKLRGSPRHISHLQKNSVMFDLCQAPPNPLDEGVHFQFLNIGSHYNPFNDVIYM